MGEIIEIVIFMWIIAIVAFAPLGYFIYVFTVGSGKSFGKSNPEDHAVENTSYYKHIDFVLSTLLGGTGKTASQATSTPAAGPISSVSISEKPRPRPRPRPQPIAEAAPEKKSKEKKKKAKKNK